MADTYVARFPVKHGAEDGSQVLLQPGDELPSDVSRKDQLDLLVAGSVVPKKVFDALKAADDAQKEADKAQADAAAEAAKAQGVAAGAQNDALLQAHAAQLNEAPEAKPIVGSAVASTTPTAQEVRIAQAQQKESPKLAASRDEDATQKLPATKASDKK